MSQPPACQAPTRAAALRHQATLRRVHAEDAIDHRAAMPWLPAEFRQLTAGRYQAVCETLDFGSISVCRERQNQTIQKAGMLPANTCTVSIACGVDPQLRFSAFGIELSSLFYLPPEVEFDVAIPAGIETLFVRLDQDELLAGAQALDPERWAHAPDRLLVMNAAERHNFEITLKTLFSHARQHAHGERAASPAASLLMDVVLLSLNSADPHLSGDPPDFQARLRAFRTVAAARECIDAALLAGRVPSIVELCRHIGVSQRTLQYSFREQLNLSPIQYLRLHRLHCVRSSLRQPKGQASTVTEIATRWGFFHLGKFARDYRQLFGERPSETLARALAG